MQKALPVAAAAAGVGLAAGIFIDAPSTQQPHALRLARADARGLRYRGVAANSSAATLSNFALSLDAVFEPVDEATFRALRRDYGGWSETASAVQWRRGEPFTLLDLLPPLFQATSGRHFRTGRRRFRGGEATRGFNCWGLAWAALEAAAAPRETLTVSCGAGEAAWCALREATAEVQSTSANGRGLLEDEVARNADLAPGDVLLVWHDNGGGQGLFLDHVAIYVDDDVYFEKAGAGDATPFRVTDWANLAASWPLAVFEWDWRRRTAEAVPPAAEVFGLRFHAPRFPELAAFGTSLADSLSFVPALDSGDVVGRAYSWIKELEAPLGRDERGRAVLPPEAFDDAAYRVETGDAWRREEAKPAPLGRVPAATCVAGGALYVFGGETDDAAGVVPNRYLNDVWRLDLATGDWEELSPDGAAGAPAPRVCSSAVCREGKLVLYGGIARGADDVFDHSPMGDLWTFDVEKKAWAPRNATGDAPGPLAGHTATLLGDAMMIFGGSREDSTLSDELRTLDLATGAWVAAAPAGPRPAPRDFHVAAERGGKLLVWGGVDDGSVWTYDGAAWASEATELPYLSGRAGTVLPDGTLLSVGGFKVVGGVAAYDADVMVCSGGGWADATPASAGPKGRCFATLAPVGDAVFVWAGYRRVDGEADERLGDLWRLDLAAPEGHEDAGELY